MKKPIFESHPIDRVDKNNKVIDVTSYDEISKNKNIGYRLSAVFVINSKNQLLMQKRSQWIDNPNMWDTRAGGIVDSKESHLQAAVRELKEELGIKIPKNKIKLIAKLRIWNNEHKYIRRYYLGKYDGKIKPDPAEVSDYKFVDINKVTTFTQDKLKPGGLRDLKILKQWLKKQKKLKK